MSSDSARAVTYPTQSQYDQWKERADSMDMSISEFMQAMIEAGSKKFEPTVDRDETHHELRRQRNDLRDELSRARSRIQELEDQLHQTEREAIRQYVAENPGTEFQEIVEHLINTVPKRVNQHLDELEGESLHVDDGEYHIDRIGKSGALA